MKKLLKKFTETSAPTGYEDALRALIKKEIKPHADDIHVDTLGNLIARKGRVKRNGRKIMLTARMDESSLIARHVDRNGFIRFSMLGETASEYLPGARVRFLDGAQGIIGIEGGASEKDVLPVDKMFIDVGATNLNDCPVKVGDIASFDRSFIEVGNRLISRAMDNRAGLVAMIECMRLIKSTPHELYFVFTARQQVGKHSAATTAYSLVPDIGISVEAIPAEDTPGQITEGIALGKGPAIKIRDQFMLADPRIVDWMLQGAKKARIPHQRSVSYSDSADARDVQLSRSGAAVGGIGIPYRYSHSPSEMIDYRDLQNTVKFLNTLLKTLVLI